MDGGQIVRSFANLSKNRYQNRKIASWISFGFSVLVLAFALYTWSIIMALIAGYFGYLALKELGYIK